MVEIKGSAWQPKRNKISKLDAQHFSFLREPLHQMLSESQ